MKKIQILCASIILLLPSVLPGGDGKRSAEQNLLLITVDTLRADYLGSYGNSDVRTPQMDALARRGVRFTRCVAHAPMTLSSHTSILTSLDARLHGVRDNHGFRAGPELMTLAEMLKPRGYATAAFVSAFVLDSRFGLDQGFDHYDDHVGLQSRQALSYTERRAEATITAAINWIQQQDGPWFVWVHLFDPHAPYDPPAPYNNRFADDLYAGEISYTDAQLGRLFAALGTEAADTIIALTSDHGEGLGDHGERTHGVFAYNSTLHVPLIIAAPGLLPPGSVVDRRVRHIDLLPTLLQLVNTPLPPWIQGQDLLPDIISDNSRPAEDSYFEALYSHLNRGWAPLYGVYTGSQKFIHLPLAELYDMEDDWQEQDNIIATNAARARSLMQYVRALFSYADDIQQQEEDQSTKEKLRDLGYLTTSSQRSATEKYGPEDDPKNLLPLEEKLDRLKVAPVQEAVAELQQMLEDYPLYREGWEVLVIRQFEAGNPQQAVAAAKAGVEAGNTDFEMLKTLAGAYFTAGQYRAALPMYRQLLEKQPRNADILGLLAMTHEQLGETDDALRLYGKSLEMDPGYFEMRLNYGTLLFQEGRGADAVAQMQKALELYPDNTDALVALGMAQEVHGDNQAAVNAYRQALDQDEDHSLALFRLITIYINLLDQPEQALPLIDRFVETADPARYGRQIENLRNFRNSRR